MGRYFDDDGVIRDLPDATPGNMEIKSRKLKDDARTVRPDKPLNRRERERVREALHEHLKGS